MMFSAIGRGRWRRIGRAEDGAAAVEMAVSITALLIAIIGMMKMCVAIYSYHYTSEAAREGARYAIVRGYTASSTQTACVAYETSCMTSADNISSYVKALGYPALIPANMTVSTSWTGFPTGVTCAPDGNCRNAGNMVTVTVQYAFPLSIPFVGSRTLNMSSTSSAIIAQ